MSVCSSTMSASQQKLNELLSSIPDLNYSDCISLKKLLCTNPEKKGGFGIVYTAQLYDKRVAVKVTDIGCQFFSDGEEQQNEYKLALKDAREEIRRWHSISNRHENILSFRGYLLDEEQKKLGLISDYMENGTLSDYIRRIPVPSDEELLPLIVGAAKGLEAIHEEGIIHRDIKSDNILISGYGLAVVCDFGLSRLIEETTTYSITSLGVRGTTRWMAPEQFPLYSDQPVIQHIRNDVWSFGMVLYECISKKIPYYDHKLESAIIYKIANYTLPMKPTSMTPFQSRLWKVCQRCWSKPETRIAMKDVVVQLNLIEGEDLHSRLINRRTCVLM